MGLLLWRIVLLVGISAGALGQEYKINPRFAVIGPCIAMGEEDVCSTANLQFYIFTRENPDEPELVEAIPDQTNLTESTFNPNHPTKIIVHGYNSASDAGVLVDIKNAYVNTGEYNVIMADWSGLAKAPCYPTAAHNARYIGRCIGELVRAVMAAGESNQMPNNLHIIGFSLGAQVAAFVANSLQPMTIPRITGLDPAFPFFIWSDPRDKLDQSDAKFVDIIHTNSLMQGQLAATGHLDFYMNGGYNQPGCGFTFSATSCSHHRSPKYFAESIVTETGFWGWPCNSFISYWMGSCTNQEESVQLMGEFADPTARGVFYVNTGSSSPFALGRGR